jgi:hypothetical protein
MTLHTFLLCSLAAGTPTEQPAQKVWVAVLAGCRFAAAASVGCPSFVACAVAAGYY